MLYSETFRSIQGEGLYTGVPSIWLRLFLCNLECKGFGQEDPTNQETYKDVGKQIDIEDITDIKELPIFEFGCDSAYSVAKKFKHLQHQNTPAEVVDILGDLLPIKGVWWNKDYEFDMVFTGGEPLLKANQKNVAEMLAAWNNKPNFKQRPQRFTFETNGTQKITHDLVLAFGDYAYDEILLSYSPKLFTVSGEPNKRAIKPEVIKYNREVMPGAVETFKFVLSPDKRAWDELEWAIDELGISRHAVWIMPVGGIVEDQHLHAGDVANMAIERGYKVSARVHAYLWGNAIGT